jgi:hypothetical protein
MEMMVEDKPGLSGGNYDKRMWRGKFSLDLNATKCLDIAIFL